MASRVFLRGPEFIRVFDAVLSGFQVDFLVFWRCFWECFRVFCECNIASINDTCCGTVLNSFFTGFALRKRHVAMMKNCVSICKIQCFLKVRLSATA